MIKFKATTIDTSGTLGYFQELTNNGKICLKAIDDSSSILYYVEKQVLKLLIVTGDGGTPTVNSFELTFSGFSFTTIPSSFEFRGITINTDDTTKVYFLIYCDSSYMIAESTPDLSTYTAEIKYLYTINSSKLPEDSYLNGLCYYKNNNLLIGNSLELSKIIRYSIKSGKIQATLTPYGVSEISDVKYNALSDTFWMLGKTTSKSGKVTKLFVWNNLFTLLQVIDIGVPVGISTASTFTTFDITSNYGRIWLCGNDSLNENYLAYFKCAINSTNLTLSAVYFAKHAIKRIMSAGKILWSILSGCFSTGKWMEDELWKDDEIWKDN